MDLDYYEILGLDRDCSASDIKKAYRRLAVRWHPDKNNNSDEATEMFKLIAEAYEVLSDEDKRELYDTYGKEGLEDDADNPYHEHYGAHEFSFQHANDIFRSFFGDDFFNNFFADPFSRRQGSGRRGQNRGGSPFDAMMGGFGMGPFGSFAGPGFPGADAFSSSFSGGWMGGPAISMAQGMSGGNLANSSSFSSIGGGGVGRSESMSSTMGPNGERIVRKTVVTTHADGSRETTTEEYVNGECVSSSTESTQGRLGY